MNLHLKRSCNKNLIGSFPSALREIERNYNGIRNDLIKEFDGHTSDDEDKAGIGFFKKYFSSMYEAWLLAQNVWIALEQRRTPIVDTNAFLILMPGICSYASNRLREMKRVAKQIANEPFTIEKSGGQVDVVGNILKQGASSNLEDLSYMYKGRPDKLQIRQKVISSINRDMQQLLIDRVRGDAAISKLKAAWTTDELNEFYDLDDEVKLLWHIYRKTNLFDHIQECLDGDDPPEIYQMFFCALADFIDVVAAEYWKFKVKYNLSTNKEAR
jgi:hypothetical protein